MKTKKKMMTRRNMSLTQLLTIRSTRVDCIAILNMVRTCIGIDGSDSNPMKIRGNQLSTCHEVRFCAIVNERKLQFQTTLEKLTMDIQTTKQPLPWPRNLGRSSTAKTSPHYSTLKTNPYNMTLPQRRTWQHESYCTCAASYITRANN